MGRQGSTSSRGKSAASAATGAGRPGAAVYRRRRLFAGGALLLALALLMGGLALGGAFGGGSEQASATDPAPSGTAAAPTSAAATPTPTPSAAPSCNQNLVTISAATDKGAYGPDDKPLLTLKVTNGGTMPCEVNIGTSQMEFLVTSGADRIFSSRDCQSTSEDLIKTIAPGASETANFPWSQARSVEGCQPVSAKPGGGGAYYIFTAKLGSKASPKAVFQLN
ncbi:membrane protein [Arthrobacter sp. ZBG10]|uniref:hypothetical protein n=1 Tax=Arthrobacter sp. ZBG10 TaxID=1676590 RepID=UPI0006834708|nr:hypothetical protein [Arthrobacter sp. ZBG10]KNH23082.1 membrane protein [Arthrobacter sp. ZBG10]